MVRASSDRQGPLSDLPDGRLEEQLVELARFLDIVCEGRPLAVAGTGAASVGAPEAARGPIGVFFHALACVLFAKLAGNRQFHAVAGHEDDAFIQAHYRNLMTPRGPSWAMYWPM